MVYRIGKELKEISLLQIDADKPTLGLISLDELRKNAQELGFSENTVAECAGDDNSFRGSLDLYEDYCFCILNLVNLNDILGERDRIGCYIKRNLLLLVDVEDADKSTQTVFSYAAAQASKMPQLCMEKVIYIVLERLLYGDCKEIERMEYETEHLEEELEHLPVERNFNARLLRMKKKLLVLRNYYEQLIDIGEELEENDGEFFAEKNLRYFRLFTAKVTRLSDNVQLLRDNLVQLREAYESATDLNLNRIMKVLTVVTVIFLPLTLIVGWYGMNFTTMPELTWEYGYIGVIALSLLVIFICIWIFKKKHLL